MIEWKNNSAVTTIEQTIGGVQTVYLSLQDNNGDVELVVSNFNYHSNELGVECSIILTYEFLDKELEITGLNLKQLDNLIVGLQKVSKAISYNMEANNG